MPPLDRFLQRCAVARTLIVASGLAHKLGAMQSHDLDYPSQRDGITFPPEPMLLDTCLVQHLDWAWNLGRASGGLDPRDSGCASVPIRA
jgi:hypothetical protein